MAERDEHTDDTVPHRRTSDGVEVIENLTGHHVAVAGPLADAEPFLYVAPWGKLTLPSSTLDQARLDEVRRIIRERSVRTLFQPIVRLPERAIVGYEAYIAPGSRFDKGGAASSKDASYHLTLLAQNRTGLIEIRYDSVVAASAAQGHWSSPHPYVSQITSDREV